jgi:hypothetical protein
VTKAFKFYLLTVEKKQGDKKPLKKKPEVTKKESEITKKQTKKESRDNSVDRRQGSYTSKKPFYQLNSVFAEKFCNNVPSETYLSNFSPYSKTKSTWLGTSRTYHISSKVKRIH